MATIEEINLDQGDKIKILARGSQEICVFIRESGGRLIIQGPNNVNMRTIIIEEDFNLKPKTHPKEPEKKKKRPVICMGLSEAQVLDDLSYGPKEPESKEKYELTPLEARLKIFLIDHPQYKFYFKSSKEDPKEPDKDKEDALKEAEKNIKVMKVVQDIWPTKDEPKEPEGDG